MYCVLMSNTKFCIQNNIPRFMKIKKDMNGNLLIFITIQKIQEQQRVFGSRLKMPSTCFEEKEWFRVVDF